MKPNKKQIHVLKEISSLLSAFALSNDISSPSLPNLIEEEFNGDIIFEDLEEKEANNLKEKVTDLFYYIRTLKY